MKEARKRKILIQLFVEEDGDGDHIGNENGSVNNRMRNGSLSFDDFLRLEGNQSEFDRRIQKAVKTAVTNARRKWESAGSDIIASKDQPIRTKEKGTLRRGENFETS